MSTNECSSRRDVRVLLNGLVKGLLAVIVSLVHLPLAISGTTGNLAGKVTDVTTGEAIIGANVLIVGSGRGGATNIKGEYLVPGIAPGRYALRISAVGYKSVEAQNVKVDVDETTVYNAKLASTDIEMEGVTVEGRRPLIDVKKTASDQTFNRDKIEQLPNLKGVQDVLSLQAGVTKFGGQLFLRGGRANETQILVDGVVVNSAGGSPSGDDANELLRQLYSGSSTTSAGVSADAIASVSTSTSGLDAEYGNAQSGVVNITTKTGSDKYSGSLQYRTDGISSGSSYNERFYSGSFGGPEPITAYLLPALGVEVPGKVSIFTNASFNQSDGPYSFSTTNFYNPVKRKVRFGGFFGNILNNLGFTYSDKQNNEFTYNFKLTYNTGTNDQVSYNYRANARTSRPLGSAYSYRDRYDSSATNISFETFNTLQWVHFFSTNTQLRTYVSQQEIQQDKTIGNLTPDQYSRVTNFSVSNYTDPNIDGFRDVGSDQSWYKRNLKVWNAKAAFESQVHRLHFLKAGAEYFYEHWQTTEILFPLSPSRFDTSQRGLYPGLGLGRWVSNNLPSRGGLWLQDNIDFPGINIKVGFRYDFFYLGKQVFADEFVRRYEAVTGLKADWLEKNSFWKQFTSGSFSPRLAISYPISERASFYFNYGRYLQYPDRDQYFRDAFYDSSSSIGNSVGNPALKPQRTVAYEAGFKQLIFDDLSLQITGFYKDVFDYATGQGISIQGRTVSRSVNLDYASTRGFEIIIEKGLSNRYSGNINYSFQVAKGRSSNPFAATLNPILASLPRETRTDYDQQHRVNLFLGYRIKPNEDVEIFGIPFDNFSASMTYSFGSGFPYTPYSPGRSLTDAYLVNTGDGPFSSQVNLSFNKGFSLFQSLSLNVSLDIINLLNRRNIDLSAGGFNSLTGAPYVYGDFDPSNRNLVYAWGASAATRSFDSRVPPFVFGAPRQINFGVRVSWD